MSYCRHEGTRMELAVCLQDAEEHVNGEAEYAVSEREIEHFRRMVEGFYYWMRDMELIDDDGNLNEHGLDDVCTAMGLAGEEDEDDE
ncbi:MAG: hypothetical protein J6112_03510 [Clostridia bacterium]|nr:hypothetical protein [Clostridia bacterium]